MADKHLKLSENVPGRFYVDSTCIDCDMCRNIAPETFTRHDEGSYSYVFKQPVTADQTALAEEALDSCPTGTIGNDGE